MRVGTQPGRQAGGHAGRQAGRRTTRKTAWDRDTGHPSHLCAAISQCLKAHRLVECGVAALQPLPKLSLHLALAGHGASQHLNQVVTKQELQIQRAHRSVAAVQRPGKNSIAPHKIAV